MLKKVIFALGLAAGMLQAQNLIKDPDFDKGMGECFFDLAPGTAKKEIITEDRTWNKCLSFELLKYRVDKDGKRSMNVICMIGRDGGKIGFKAEPNTTYQFQFEFKGKIIPRVKYTLWNGPDLWKNMKMQRANLELLPVASKEWTVVKGSFTTARDTQRAALTLEIFGGDAWGGLPPLGPAFMIDKVRVEKKATVSTAGSVLRPAKQPAASGSRPGKAPGTGPIITCNPITSDPAVPYFPVTLANPSEKIAVRSAGNDVTFVSLAVTNTTDKLADYRIVVSSLDRDGDEIHQLQTEDGKIYPPDQMVLYRSVRVKTSNNKTPNLCFDPLAPMDLTQTVTVGPRESVPVWIKFNTKNVTPGVYKGFVRVIPLGEPGTRKEPAYRDVPFSFEVLPFAFTQDFPVYHCLFQLAPHKDCFRQMLESHNNTFLLSPYRANYSFDEKGNITDGSSETIESNIRDYQAWAKGFGAEGRINYCLCYNVYLHFRDVVAQKRFKPFTPEWETAWLAYMKEIDAIRQRNNIPVECWSIEIADEPKKELFPELTRAAELAIRDNPDVRFLVSFVWDVPERWDMQEEQYMKLVPYVHEWTFHTISGFSMPKYKGLLEELRKQKKLISIYACSTSMREDLQTYYRRHAWTVPCFDLQGCHMYQHTNHKFKFHDWKEPAEGEVALLSGPHTVTTIRGECLNAGFSDLQYYMELKRLYEKMDRNSALAKEIREFLEKAPKELVLNPPESASCFDDAREQMIDLILKARR